MHTYTYQEEVFSTLWCIGWLFSIGYLDLKFWKGVLALFIWPYYIGKKVKKIEA